MNPATQKLRLIFRPFIIVFLAYLIVYTSLYWWFFVANEYFHFKEDVAKFVIPALTTWIPVFIWVRPRLKLLVFSSGKRSESPTTYSMIIAFGMLLTTIVAVDCVNIVTGKLTKLTTINEIYDHGASRYYTVENLFIDKAHPAELYTASVSGRRSKNLNMYLSLAFPLMASAADTGRVNCAAWLGVEFDETINNLLDAKEKEAKKKAFIERAHQELNATAIDKFEYLERIGYTDQSERISTAVAQASRYAQPGPQLLRAVDQPFASKAIKPVLKLFGWFVAVSLVVYVMIWLRNIKKI